MAAMTVEEALAVFQKRLDACTDETCIFCESERPALATLREAAKDAERYRWLRDMKCNHFHLTLNAEHAPNYMTAAQWIEESPEWYSDTPKEELAKMAETNTIWCFQVYPSTPIGFYTWNAATLDAAIDAAMGVQP